MEIQVGSEDVVISLPVQAPKTKLETSPLVSRLVNEFNATWVDETNVKAWSAEGGDRVLLLAGDRIRFPEGEDVAVVLPELQRSMRNRFAIGVTKRESEDAVASLYGVLRWPTLVFLRDGKYVSTISGMLDWDIYLTRVEEALEKPYSRVPIAISVAGQSTDSSCH